MPRKSKKFLLKQTLSSGEISSREIDIKSRELPALLRDAQLTWRDPLVNGEPNLRKRDERERARVSALEALVRMYREAEKRGALHCLDPRVRNLIERVKTSNGGNLPKPKGGRPFGHRNSKRLSLAIKIHEAMAARGKTQVDTVLHDMANHNMADQLNASYHYLYEIHYDRDPEWKQDVKAELAHRKWEKWQKTLPYSPALWFWAVEFDPMAFILYDLPLRMTDEETGNFPKPWTPFWSHWPRRCNISFKG